HPVCLEWRDPVARAQAERYGLALAARHDRPRDCTGPEVLGDLDHKNTPLASCLEMRRLPLIGRARFDPIVWPDGDVEGFFRIPVVVADEHAEAAVGIRVPPFECGCNAGTALALRIEGQIRLSTLGGAEN